MGITKICPPPSELCGIKTNLHCPEEGCKKSFSNSSNLDMHLLKHHKKENIWKKDKGESCQYHCPVEECIYNLKSNQSFKCLKYLKQHYLKVHAEKSFQCDKCPKGFSTEAALKYHSRVCGLKFVCSCEHAYDSYEALLTHAKRVSHTFDEKYRSCGKKLTNGDMDKDKTPANPVREVQPISTAITVPVHFLAAIALSELSGKGIAMDKGVQTDDQVMENKRTKKAPSPFKSCERALKRRMSAQTQTRIVLRNKRPKISAQTQTVGDTILKKAMKDANIPYEFQKKQGTLSNSKKRRKSMETQTTNCIKQNKQTSNFSDFSHLDSNFSSIHDFASTSEMNLSTNPSRYQMAVDVGLPDLWVGQKNSSGTQTSPIAMTTLMDQEELLSHSVTQTDLNLAFLESDTCEPVSNGIHSGSQTMRNLPAYFEDNSSCSFSAAGKFESGLATSSCRSNMESALGSLTDESGYSPTQMDTFLGQHRKIVFDENRSCSIETQTELDITDSFLSECTDDGDTSFTFCSTIETQTTEEFPSFDQLLYSNMYTQTCDETFYSELGFVNIQTQTAWPQFTSDDSMFVSTETQTALSVASANSNRVTNSETSHMETQTNVDEFREFIAELSKDASVGKLL